MAEDDAPKSAYEITLERLKQQDREAGIEDKPLTHEQRERIAELRKLYEAKLAEREILHHASLRKASHDLEATEKLDAEYRRDRERLVSERDRKIAQARAG